MRVHLLDLKGYYRSPPYQLGLLVAAAQLDPAVRDGVDFVFTSHPREESHESIAEAIEAEGADLLASSCYAWTHHKVQRLLSRLDGSPRAPKRILLGGPTVSGAFGDVMLQEHRNLDAVVVGEGEPAFQDITRGLVAAPDGDPFAGARNTVRRSGDLLVRGPMGARVKCLDDTPSPYVAGVLPVDPSPVFYETNRGCPYRCAFCYWGNGQSKLYRMSHARVREEIDFLLERGASSLWITDANFGIFPDDSDIAQIIVDSNEAHGRPLHLVGVNWAKQSSDRVLEIASKFTDAGIHCSATLALQTVTPEAETLSRRYSLPPSRFVSLIGEAQRRGIPTYTDVIWGLPGETYDAYADGLARISMSGVPAIMAHQLSLLPGTELWERRDELGLRLLGDEPVADASVDASFRDYVVVEHPLMSREDMHRGARLMGINHVLHNHDLGRFANAWLARYDLGPKDAFEVFDDLLASPPADADPDVQLLLRQLDDELERFARNPGADETIFMRQLSEYVWFGERDGRRVVRWPTPLNLARTLYAEVLRRRDVQLSETEAAVFDDIVRLNAVLAPKPMWKQREPLAFRFDVARLWTALHDELVSPLDSKATWGDRRVELGDRLKAVSADPGFFTALEGPVRYSVDNPFRFPPSMTNIDWVPSTARLRCRVSLAEG